MDPIVNSILNLGLLSSTGKSLNDKNNYCSLRSFVIIIASICAVFFLFNGLYNKRFLRFFESGFVLMCLEKSDKIKVRVIVIFYCSILLEDSWLFICNKNEIKISR